MRIFLWLVPALGAIAIGQLKASQTNELTLYVSPAGNNNATGTSRATAFATIERARDEIRSRKRNGRFQAGRTTVELAAGEYLLTRPIAFTSDDSGNVNAPIVYRGSAGAEVRLVGGLYPARWTAVSDPEVRNALNAAAREHVVEIDLAPYALADLGSFRDERVEPVGLVFRGHRMTLARYPQAELITIVGVARNSPFDIRGTAGDRVGEISYVDEHPGRWSSEQDAWVHGYWFWDWAEERQPIAAIDRSRHVMMLSPPYHQYGYRVGQGFYAFNVLAELDVPGEYYLDRARHRIYFYPPPGGTSADVVVTLAQGLLRLKGAENLRFEGLICESCRGAAVEMTDSRRVVAARCVFRNIGGNAVDIIGGHENGVQECEIYRVGGSGIQLVGGDRATLTPGNHFADSNRIHNYAETRRTYHPGVGLAGVGNRATHNTISHAPHLAIGFEGNEHVIEWNEIHHVCEQSNDAGAIYAGRDWTQRGTIIRANYLHDIAGLGGRGSMGVYLDDQLSGITVSSNVFHRVATAVLIGGGRDCAVTNNVFLECGVALSIDARGIGWAASGSHALMKALHAAPYTSPPWARRYPHLVDILHDHPMEPRRIEISGNVCAAGKWANIDRKARQALSGRRNRFNLDTTRVKITSGQLQLSGIASDHGEIGPGIQLAFVGPLSASTAAWSAAAQRN